MKFTNIGTCIVHMGYVIIPQTATIFSEKLGKKEQVSSTKTYPKALIQLNAVISVKTYQYSLKIL